MTRNKGFTLVEILMVVIILGILAAIVIPQFSSASSDARESSLSSDLQTLRSQIELYSIQHNDRDPHLQSTDSAPAWTADYANFVGRMTGQTNQYGQINGTGTKFGPYVQAFPTNSINNLNTLTVTGHANPGSNAYGWQYDPNTGRIAPDDKGKTAGGVNHSEL